MCWSVHPPMHKWLDRVAVSAFPCSLVFSDRRETMGNREIQSTRRLSISPALSSSLTGEKQGEKRRVQRGKHIVCVCEQATFSVREREH